MDILSLFTDNTIAIGSVLPEIGLTVLALAILLIDSYRPNMKSNIGYIAAITMALLTLIPFFPGLGAAQGESTLVWGGMIRHDILSQVFKTMVLLAGAITSLMATKDSDTGQKGEFYLVITISTLGGTLLASAADLIMVFVALETLSIPLYILASFSHKDQRSSESGLKYFLFGSFATALLLYGFSLLFGFTGETRIDLIAKALASGESMIGNSFFPPMVAVLLVMVGFGFKISAAPFHFWTPDVYEGAPTPVTAYVSVASKAASFAVLMRFFLGLFPVQLGDQSVAAFWTGAITITSIASMTLGNVLALRQSNMKRMLAYSSIAQGGYALMGVAALSATHNTTYAISSVAFYMFMYTFSNLLVFAGVLLFAETAGTEEISEYAGMQRRSPWLALAISLGLLSLSGIPPAAGFFGKFFIFQATVEAHLVGLAVIGVLNAIVGLYYYLTVIRVIWVDKGKDEDQPIAIPRALGWTFGVSSVVVILLGVLPSPVIEWARDGAQAIVAVASSIFGVM